MSTRMEIWKKYRNEIEDNYSTRKITIASDEKLGILYERLLKIFPKYEKKYKDNNTSLSFRLKEIPLIDKYSSSDIKDMLEKINDTEENFSSSFSVIEDINFSSKKLDDIIFKVKKGKNKSKDYISIDESNEIVLEKTKKIKIGESIKSESIKKINIAIDGPSGSGKSTVARKIAKKFGYVYINTGLVYRAIALFMLDNNIDISLIDEKLAKIKIELLEDEKVMLNGKDVTKQVRSDAASQNASIVAAIPEVREFALKIQQQSALKKGVIMDGRDTTFKVLPDAELKIFLDTDPEIRALRRSKQNKELGFSTDYEGILKDIKDRDRRDRDRKIDPLHKTNDAILIDASNMSLNDVVIKIEKLIKEKF